MFKVKGLFVMVLVFSSLLYSMNQIHIPQNEGSIENSFLDRIAQQVDPNNAQKLVRMQLKGSESDCLHLFKDACKEKKPAAQIYLANTYFAMKHFSDSTKDFNHLSQEQLESYNFSLSTPGFLTCLLAKVNGGGVIFDYAASEEQKDQIISDACQQGNIYAHVLKARSEKGKGFHFGTACKIKQLLDKAQFHELLYCFGASLFNAGQCNPQYALEGLNYMEQSGFLDLRFHDEEESFDSSFYNQYGIRSIGTTIFVSSREYWNQFKKEKLEQISSSPGLYFDLFKRHDMASISNLQEKYKLSIDAGRGRPGVISEISIYSNYYSQKEELGTLSLFDVETRTINNLDLSYEYRELLPVIAFLRDALACSTDASSVCKIMESIEHYS